MPTRVLVLWISLAALVTRGALAADVEIVPIRNDLGQRPLLMVPRTAIDASQLAVVVNDADPQSVNVGNYYAAKHGIASANVIHVSFPAGNDSIPEADFNVLKTRIDAQADPGIQAYAITWSRPWKVGAGMSITSALALGYNARYVASSVCNTTAPVSYYDSASVRPWTDHGLRPAMVVGGATTDYARAVVDRGVLARQNFPGGNGWFFRTTDSARSVRYTDFRNTATSWNRADALRMSYVDNASGSGLNYLENTSGVLFYLTGLANVPAIATNRYVPGAVTDHMTSYGGALFGGGQMSVLRWLEAGATASYGTVVEPCNYTQKFPAASILVRHYFGGSTVLEAYWKSVNQPGEGIFVGDPLARPFGTAASIVNGVLEVTTTILKPGKTYSLLAGDGAQGPFNTLETGISVTQAGYRRISSTSGNYPYYQLVEGTVTSTPAPAPALAPETAPGDSTAPVVTITQPAAGSTVQGKVSAGATVSDSSAISAVTFSVDGVSRTTDNAAPFSWTWDTQTLANGTHTLSVSARDSAGNEGRASIAVQVNNPVTSSTTERTTGKGRLKKSQLSGTRTTRAYATERRTGRWRLR